MLVIGSAVFNQHASVGENMTALRRALGEPGDQDAEKR
jgi:hypothetical protein